MTATPRARVLRTPVLSALYVPGDRPERFAKAAASGADPIVIDLEDAVVAGHKAAAREHVAAWLTAAPHLVRTEVRVNGDPAWASDDLDALRGMGSLAGVRLPKVESAADVRAAVELLQPGRSTGVTALLESARGVEAAYEIAMADPHVTAIALGESDLASDLGTQDEEALGWARSRVVVAARAAGLPAPLMSVYPHVADLDGLDRSCRGGRSLGMVGRSAIHPRQIPVIVAAFSPTQDECDRASQVLAAVRAAQETGRGVVALPDGRMVDPAMTGRARSTLALADAATRARRVLRDKQAVPKSNRRSR